MKAVTYRRSVTENPDWLNRQESDCRRYADEHGLTITEVFTDIGRPSDGLRGVLDAVAREDVTGLIVTDLARRQVRRSRRRRPAAPRRRRRHPRHQRPHDTLRRGEPDRRQAGAPRCPGPAVVPLRR
ncbi:recombinase family protein [Kocuria soli]|uniref:Recombinase family protein n=1 Tax=Kocuria soli TaxID=2485125 RepID=A0A3N4AEI8_9MICC|nr:recombinase family protein [Kocuria soli]